MERIIYTYIDDLGTDESAGFSRKNADGTYTIVLNARYSDKTQAETYEHELKHIESGHLDTLTDIQDAELEVRGKKKRRDTICGIPYDEFVANSREVAARKLELLRRKQTRARNRKRHLPAWVTELELQMGKEQE